MAKRLEETKRRLTVFKFDELNTLTEIDRMYAGMELDNRNEFEQLFRERYSELWQWLKKKKPDEDLLDDLLDMYLAGLLGEPNEQTRYVYNTEALRKRDRAKESVLAAPTRAQKQLELEKAVRYWSQQTGFYVDICSQDAEWQAYKDAGVKKVRWCIYGDDRVCATCEDMDGNVYDIDKVPERPHLRCRCYLVPVN